MCKKYTKQWIQYKLHKDFGEYSLKELTDAWNKDSRIKFVHWCDDFVSQFEDIKK